MRALGILCASFVMVACEQRTQAPATPAPASAAVSTPTPELQPAVTIDPRLAKLVETPDPDLESKLTDAEVRAALRDATRPEPTIAAPERPMNVGASEWARMEKVRAGKVKQWREFLSNTRIAIGPDNLYHQQGCQSLYATRVENGRAVQSYIGKDTVLATAEQSNMRAHADCAPPSHRVPSGFWDTEG